MWGLLLPTRPTRPGAHPPNSTHLRPRGAREGPRGVWVGFRGVLYCVGCCVPYCVLLGGSVGPSLPPGPLARVRKTPTKPKLP